MANLNIVVKIIRPHSRPFIVSTWYKPPNSPQDIFRQFESLIDKVDSEQKCFYLLGDLNCNMHDGSNHNSCTLTNILDMYGLSQLISEPTRLTPTSRTLILTSITSSPEKIGAVTHTTVNGFSHGKFPRRTSHLGFSFPWFQRFNTREKRFPKVKRMSRSFPRLLNPWVLLLYLNFLILHSSYSPVIGAVCFTNFGRTLSEHPRNSSIISKNSKDSLPRPVFLLLSTIALYLSNSALHFSFIWAKLLELPMPAALQCSVKVSQIMGVARGGGGSWGARDPPFVSLFVSKQPTIFRWQFGEYPMYELVWPPFEKSFQCDPPFEKSWLRPCKSSPTQIFFLYYFWSCSDFHDGLCMQW